MPTSRIAIIGGGPGGPTLARILQKHGIHVTVYEQEHSANARSQGGSLDLHHESGLKALREADLFNDFLKCARYESQHMRVLDKKGVVYLDEGEMGPLPEIGDEQSRPEIDRFVTRSFFYFIFQLLFLTLLRTQLRQILLDSLEKDTVKWNHKVKSITPLPTESQHKLLFANGHEETVDLVIGADGAWSTVRSLLSPAKPVYSGITFIDLTITSVDTLYPAIASIVRQGMALILSDGKGIILQRNSGGRVRVYVAVRESEDWVDTYQGGIFSNTDTSNANKVKEHIVNLFPGWDSSILDSVRRADSNSIIPRKIYALPYPHRWESKAGITLLGDAAHLMLPSGEGVNIAMIDAMDLALTIVKSGSGAEGIQVFEKKMSERAAGLAKESAVNMEIMFSQESPKSFLDHFASLMSQGGPPGEVSKAH